MSWVILCYISGFIGGANILDYPEFVFYHQIPVITECICFLLRAMEGIQASTLAKKAGVRGWA